MQKRKILISLFVIIANTVFSQNYTSAQYIDSFKEVAMKEMIDFKIPASITLAQGLLESGSGNSRLAKQGNNHFGIKCKKTWTGCTILEDDDALQECFRCYTNAEASYKDHSMFLRDNPRYSKLFEMDIMDYKKWAKGLLDAGYATNKQYANLLIKTIERYNLAHFDTMVQNGYIPFSNFVEAKIAVVPNRVPLTVIQPNQTIETIAESNQKTVKKLAKYNDLEYHGQISPGDVLYLRPKRRKASVPNHEVKAGETMWEISQKYAIKISTLYKKNLMEPGTEPASGTVLNLRTKAISMPDTGRTHVESIEEQESNYHIVAGGETLYSISRLFSVTVEDLVKMNGLVNHQIQVGQKLKIKEENKTNSQTTITRHIVLSGETLYSISKKYNVSIESIRQWNKLKGDGLSVGQIIEIR